MPLPSGGAAPEAGQAAQTSPGIGEPGIA